MCVCVCVCVCVCAKFRSVRKMCCVEQSPVGDEQSSVDMARDDGQSSSLQEVVPNNE